MSEQQIQKVRVKRLAHIGLWAADVAAQARFYRELRRDGCLLHVFRPNDHRDGPIIRIYEVSDTDSTSAAALSPDCIAPSI